jgi:uncharacterized protein YggE
MKRILLCCLLITGAGAAQAQDRKPDFPLLTVVGSGEVRARPDEATVRLGVVAQATNAGSAQADANAIIQRFLDRVRDLKVPRENVQTSQLTLSPIYRQPAPGGEPQVVGYRAQNTLAIRLQDLDLIGKVIDAGVAAGANQLEGIAFGLRNDTPARLRALREAVAEARQKAEVIADALGVRLGDAYEVDEGGARVIPPPIQGRALAAGDASTPVEPGQLVVNASVTIRYRLAAR